MSTLTLVMGMGIFSRSVDMMFVVDGQGRDVFFPFGRWGRGRMVGDKDDADRLKKRLSWLHIGNMALLAVLFLVLVVYLNFSIFEWAIISLLFDMPVQLFVTFRMVRRCPISETKLPRYWRHTSQFFSARLMWFSLILSIFAEVLIGGGILFAYAFDDEHPKFTFGLGILLFVLIASPFFWGRLLYVRKFEQNKIDPNIFS